MPSPRTYATAGAFRRALEERLKRASLTDQIDLNRLRRQVSFDRLLARLFREEPAPWVLKGGYALELRFKAARSTVDIDLTLQRVGAATSAGGDTNQVVRGMLFGVSISPNTIKRNELSYRIYVASRRPPRRKQLREAGLMQLVNSASGPEKRSMWSKTARLRRESKDSLIARLISLERTVRQQQSAENLLREEILRLAQAGSR